MAGALNLALAGPRIYSGYTVDDRYLNAPGRMDANSGDIARALRILLSACCLQAGLIVALSLWRPF